MHGKQAWNQLKWVQIYERQEPKELKKNNLAEIIEQFDSTIYMVIKLQHNLKFISFLIYKESRKRERERADSVFSISIFIY